MATCITSQPAEPVCDVNTTPLIDVMLVLLIMFIVTLPIMTHSVNLEMPGAPPHTRPLVPDVIYLEVDADGTVVWNGSVVSDLEQLEGYFRSEALKKPQPEVHLHADRRVKYGAVAVVLAAAQRNHMHKIGFANISEFSD